MVFEEAYTIIDTHCHVDLFRNPHELAKRTQNKKIKTIAVTNLPSHFKLGLPHIRNYKNIRIALGLHPQVKIDESELKIFKEMVEKTSYIGEIGLDFSREYVQTKESQVNNFKFILETTKKQPKFMTVHSRKAEQHLLNLLKAYQHPPVVFHWYTGPINLIKEIVEEGHYFSINTAMINSNSGKEIIKKIPSTKILTESDGPFIKVKGMPAEPSHVSMVITYLSNTWGISESKVEKSIENNFQNMIYRDLRLR